MIVSRHGVPDASVPLVTCLHRVQHYDQRLSLQNLCHEVHLLHDQQAAEAPSSAELQPACIYSHSSWQRQPGHILGSRKRCLAPRTPCAPSQANSQLPHHLHSLQQHGRMTGFKVVVSGLHPETYTV